MRRGEDSSDIMSMSYWLENDREWWILAVLLGSQSTWSSQTRILELALQNGRAANMKIVV